MYLLIYSVGRFGIEFYRGDLIRGQLGGFATSQWIAIGVVLITGLAFVIQARKTGE
ncbi:hypothetical protein PA598K_00060 [Paenibacillus sp. 598K]|nr:hypothetical protein PA598K_00060 [Paenibacillus sp. 598K]